MCQSTEAPHRDREAHQGAERPSDQRRYRHPEHRQSIKPVHPRREAKREGAHRESGGQKCRRCVEHPCTHGEEQKGVEPSALPHAASDRGEEVSLDAGREEPETGPDGPVEGR